MIPRTTALRMRPVDTSQCLAHVLVCVNNRTDSQLPCCGDDQRAEAVYRRLKKWIERHGLNTSIWLTKTDCLGWCTTGGATVVIYPEDAWYRAVTPDDCQRLIDDHLEPLVDSGQ